MYEISIQSLVLHGQNFEINTVLKSLIVIISGKILLNKIQEVQFYVAHGMA